MRCSVAPRGSTSQLLRCTLITSDSPQSTTPADAWSIPTCWLLPPLLTGEAPFHYIEGDSGDDAGGRPRGQGGLHRNHGPHRSLRREDGGESGASPCEEGMHRAAVPLDGRAKLHHHEPFLPMRTASSALQCPRQPLAPPSSRRGWSRPRPGAADGLGGGPCEFRLRHTGAQRRRRRLHPLARRRRPSASPPTRPRPGPVFAPRGAGGGQHDVAAASADRSRSIREPPRSPRRCKPPELRGGWWRRMWS